MDLQYTVHYCTKGDHAVSTEIDGEPAQIVKQKVILEMTPDDNDGGAIKLVLPASAGFEPKNGDTVTVSFSINKKAG